MVTKMEAKHPFSYVMLYTTLQYCWMSSGLCMEMGHFFVEAGDLYNWDCDLVLVRFYATFMSNETSWDLADHGD
jgi:hypothetical protein